MPNTVNIPCPQYNDMWDHWRLLLCLLAGTPGMRSAGNGGPYTGDGTLYLPKMQRESDDAYLSRLNQTVLFNAFKRTLRVLTGLPFRQRVQLGEGSDVIAVRLENDMDRRKSTLTGFSRKLLWDLLLFGKCHFFVDAPVKPVGMGSAAAVPTMEDEIRLNLFPYFVYVSPLDIIGWQSAWTQTGEMLTQVRQRTCIYVQNPEDEFQMVERNAVRVWEIGQVREYEEQRNATEGGSTTTDFVLTSTKQFALQEIPLITVYASEELTSGLLTSMPPLEDLAWENCTHWQSSSDQRNILHFARVYLTLFAGFQEDEVTTLEIGPGFAISNPKEGAHVDVIEHSGNSISAGERDIQNTETRMQGMGADWTAKRPVNTATERIIDNIESMSDLQSVVRNLEEGLQHGFELAGRWRGQAETKTIVNIYQDFDSYGSDAGHAQRFLRAQAGYITPRRLLTEDKRFGLFSEDMDVEDELAEAQTDSFDQELPTDEKDPATLKAEEEAAAAA